MPSVLFSNNASGALASSITSTGTTITLTTGGGAQFPAISGGNYFYATLTDSSNNLEIVKVTARATDVFTVVRAQEGTIGRAYAAADKLELRVTAAVMNSLPQLAADQTFSGVNTFTTPLAVASGGTGVSTSTGTGAVVRAVAPNLDAETYSTNAAVTAAGGTQATATALTADFNVVTTVIAGQGVVLPTATAGRRIIVINRGGNALNVYPATSARIDSGFVNAALVLPVDGFIEINAASATDWYSTYYTSVQNALRSVQLLTTNWVVYESGGKLIFKYGGLIGTTVMSLDSSGNLIVAGDITGFGTP